MVGQLRILFLILLELCMPCSASFATALSHSRFEMLHHAVGNVEFRVFRPAVVFLGELDLGIAERFAVSAACVLLVGGAVSDVAVDDDQSRAVRCLLGGIEGALQHLEIIGIANSAYVPAIAHESRGYVF